jgi:Gpi18-like mannosyltransferase
MDRIHTFFCFSLEKIGEKGEAVVDVLRRSLIIFFIHKIWVSAASLYFVAHTHRFHTWKSYLQYSLIGNFAKWDSYWYISIAAHGYTKISAAFFPLYPAAMRYISGGFGVSYRAAGLLISNLSLLAALYFLGRLIERDYKADVFWRAGLLLVLFPTGFYLSSAYTEAMFLLWVTGCMYFSITQRWWLAGLFGMLASLTRNTGILMLFPVTYEYMRFVGWNWRKIRLNACAFLLIPFGLALYMFHLRSRLGDPLAFVHAQKYWHREFRFPWTTWLEGTRHLLISTRKGWGLIYRWISWTVATLELLGTGLALRLKLRGSYLFYLLPAVLIPLMSPNVLGEDYFYSIPRFFLTAFPLLITAAIVLARKPVFLIMLLASAAGQWYLMYHITVGHFVS